MIDKAVTREIIKEQNNQLKREGKNLIERYGWKIEVRDTAVYVNIRSIKDDEEYMLRIQCNNYPEKRPTIEFVDPSSRKPKLSAWPIIRPKAGRPAIQTDRMFICFGPSSSLPYTYTIGEIIYQIQSYLNSEGYKGRHPG